MHAFGIEAVPARCLCSEPNYCECLRRRGLPSPGARSFWNSLALYDWVRI
jgi:hypothetical protein